MRFSRVFEIFFGYCGCMLVIAGACWLLHVHVAYLRSNNHIRMHAKVENVNCSISRIITVQTWKYNSLPEI
jgi:hypothetical protein